MATVEQLTFEHFSTTPGITALHYVEAINPTTPYAVVFRVSDTNVKEFLAQYGGEARMQFDIYTTDRFELPVLIENLKKHARSFRGPKQGYYIASCIPVNQFQRAAEDDKLYRGVIDMIVRYQETGE